MTGGQLLDNPPRGGFRGPVRRDTVAVLNETVPAAGLGSRCRHRVVRLRGDVSRVAVTSAGAATPECGLLTSELDGVRIILVDRLHSGFRDRADDAAPLAK